MTPADPFEDRLRHDLLAALPAHRSRRRRRGRALVVALTAVLVLGAGWAAAARDPGSTERASAGPSSAPSSAEPAGEGDPTASASSTAPDGSSTTSQSTVSSSVPPVEGTVPGGPALTPATVEASIDLMSTFLAHLRAGDVDAAVPLISEYATMTGPPDGGERATVEAFAADHAWLLADADPELLVTPSPGWQVASPVVTVVVDAEEGIYRAAAFVLSDGLGAPSGPPQIQRLPDGSGPETTPRPGTPLVPGQRVTFAGGATEGGIRTFVDGVEVATTVHGEFLDSSSFTVPADAAGAIVVTRSVSTPELPGAEATWYPVADG